MSRVEETIDFVVTLDSEEDFDYASWELGFTYDSNELAFSSAIYGNGLSAIGITDDINDGNLTISAALPFGDTDLHVSEGDIYNVVTLTFTVDILSPFDGFADLELLNQSGNQGFFNGITWEATQFDGALAADIGVSPVPIPGALILFASGVVGFLGVRKKTI